MEAEGTPHPAGLELRLRDWLANDARIDGPRRVARSDASRVLVSKCPPGFFAELNDVIDRLPELFEVEPVRAAYETIALSSPHAPRVECWHRALVGLLATLAAERGISPRHETEVRVGIDSAVALLDGILWSGPQAGRPFLPSEGEVAAYREALDADRDLFTRFYGVFEGRIVVNRCPGAAFGRELLAQGWLVCTGSEPPAATGET